MDNLTRDGTRKDTMSRSNLIFDTLEKLLLPERKRDSLYLAQDISVNGYSLAAKTQTILAFFLLIENLAY